MEDTKKIAYSEVLEILNRNAFVYDKMPRNVIKFLQKNSSKFYEVKCPRTENILNYVSKDALNLYVSIYIDYAANEKEKEELKQILIQNEMAS